MTARTAVVSIRQGAPRIGRLRPVAITAVLALLCVPGVAAGSVSPLPSSDYTVHAVCARAARGRGGCLALQLVPGPLRLVLAGTRWGSRAVRR